MKVYLLYIIYMQEGVEDLVSELFGIYLSHGGVKMADEELCEKFKDRDDVYTDVQIWDVEQ